MSGWRNDEEQKAHDARALAQANEIIRRNEAAAKAQASADKDGLILNVTYDETGRQRRNYSNANGYKQWMNPWRSEGVRIERFITHHPGSDLHGVEYIRQDSPRFNALVRGGK
jgi:hypothetical protein